MLLRPLRHLRCPWLVVSLLVALCAPLAAAPQQPLESVPGYIPIDTLGLFAHQQVSVEVNLSGPLLELVAAATRSDDPDFSRIMAGLRAIQVRVITLNKAPANSASARAQLAEAGHWLEQHGWIAIVRVNKGGEDDSIYTLLHDKEIMGLAVLHFEIDKEAALVNIVGHLDPTDIGRLGKKLDLPELEHVPLPRQPH
jgi:hypothetical protein